MVVRSVRARVWVAGVGRSFRGLGLWTFIIRHGKVSTSYRQGGCTGAYRLNRTPSPEGNIKCSPERSRESRVRDGLCHYEFQALWWGLVCWSLFYARASLTALTCVWLGTCSGATAHGSEDFAHCQILIYNFIKMWSKVHWDDESLSPLPSKPTQQLPSVGERHMDQP